MVDIVHHDRPAEQVLRQAPVLLFHLYEGVGKAHNPLFPKRLRAGQPSAPADACKREKGSPPIPVLLQEIDHPLGRLLRVCDNVLDAASKGGLNGNLILLVHLDDVRHHAQDALFLFSLLHNPADAAAVAVIPLGDIFQGLQAGLLPVVGGLPHPQLLRLSGELPLQSLYLLLTGLVLIGKSSDLLRDLLQLFPVLLRVPLMSRWFIWDLRTWICSIMVS